ncbi:MAG: cytochrome c biogenesis protein CcsA, partial [Candidatus Omnitrophica bacterium]|nr:cytochrome c biogenesis protein CcsA [Candidatus Omnitrophota bacterium]
MNKIFFKLLMSVLLALGAAAPAVQAQVMEPKGVRSVSVFKRIPILDNGRIKPLDTYARNLLVQLSGRQSFKGKPAVAWLARLVFSPDLAKTDKVFLINHPAIPGELGIAADKHRRYSFAELEPHLDQLTEIARAAQNISEKERDVVDAEVIRIFNNLRTFVDLTHVFQFAFPTTDFTVSDPQVSELLGFPNEQTQFSFLDIAFAAEPMLKAMDDLQRKDSSSWNAQDQMIVGLVSNLFRWSQVYKDLPLTIVPTGDERGTWISPWDAIAINFRDDTTRREMNFLRNVVVSYWNGEQLQFDLNTRLYIDSVKGRMGERPAKVLRRMDTELFYNKADFFLYSKMLYLFAFVLFLVSLVFHQRVWHKIGVAAVVLGFIPHVWALALRIIILERPPVSNLYETFIFVGFVVVLLGLWIEYFNRKWLGLVTASVGGFILLMIAAKYSAEGDTLKMLIAVLNSNFWLSTHVISITAGYGSTCAAGILGHVYLLQAIFKKKDTKLLESTYYTLAGMLGLALTLTFLGTNLGGIWADQSWGRFWGWDPKENGALMIVLWTAMLFHMRIAHWIGPVGLAVGAVLGTIVVVWAWF